MGWPSKTGPLLGLIFHSDRDSQYCSHAFRDALRAGCLDVRQSMSRKGECWDNACAESFFATLKRELERLDGRRSAAEVRRSVFMYVETYYNRVCAHFPPHAGHFTGIVVIGLFLRLG